MCLTDWLPHKEYGDIQQNIFLNGFHQIITSVFVPVIWLNSI
uniref:Uncharacterized protein n=1 Tax=Anguilla anguilla TaxID=7936 RepID=A0A0E9TL22_ANGAN